MKLLFEHVRIAPDRSWRGLHRRLPAIPFEWHYHPEYELTLTLDSCGRRYVGDHIGHYDHGDLVLLGPNLPHTWHSVDAPAPSGDLAAMGTFDEAAHRMGHNGGTHQAFVFWFSSDWIEAICQTMPELAGLKPILSTARRGAAFGKETGLKLAELTARFDRGAPADQLVLLIEVLRILLDDGLVEPLASERFDAALPVGNEAGRLGKVLDLVHASYIEPLSSAELAQESGMSERTLRRFFKHHMGSSIQEYVMGLRLGRAASLLLSSDLPVYRIAEEAGFQNLSHFNRQFARHKGATPTAFRRARFDPVMARE